MGCNPYFEHSSQNVCCWFEYMCPRSKDSKGCLQRVLAFSCSVLSDSFVTLWTKALQAPLPTGFSRHKHWSGLSLPPPGNLPNPRIEPVSPVSPGLSGRFFATEPPGVTFKHGKRGTEK